MKAILFVDDHEVLARLSCEILEMQGYRAVNHFELAHCQSVKFFRLRHKLPPRAMQPI